MHVTDVPLKRESSKTLVYFMGAGFCPYCAAERWAIIEALRRFGEWKNLIDDKSAGHDEKYLNLATLSFARASYESQYVEFVGRETADRNSESLQELGDSDYSILDTYNPDQIIPFTLIDGQYMQVGSGYSPQLLEGLTHEQVRQHIAAADSPVGKAIRTEIDNITALVCASLGKQSPACENAAIKHLLTKLRA